MKVSKDTYVKFSYTFKTENGTVVYASDANEPPWFIPGNLLIMPAMEDAMLDQENGASLTITLDPDNAFGPHRPELVYEMSREKLPKDLVPEPGMVLDAMDRQGGRLPVTVTKVGEETLLVDANHPLAGTELTCAIDILDVREPTEAELGEVKQFLASQNVKSYQDEDGAMVLEFGPDDEDGHTCMTATPGSCANGGCCDAGSGGGNHGCGSGGSCCG